MGEQLPRQAGLLLTLAIIAGLFAHAAAQAQSPSIIRISCGSSVDYKSNELVQWSKDYGYSGGSVGNLTLENSREYNFTTLRFFTSADGPNNCYNITVPNGHYLVRFLFSFGEADNGGREPQFDVSLEGSLDFSLIPGWSNSDDTSYADSMVFVDDTTVTACFHSTGHGNPAVVTLEILELYENAYDLGLGPDNHNYLLNVMARVSCGAQKAAYGTTLGADAWGGDRYWSRDVYQYAGNNVQTVKTTSPIRNSNVPPNFYPQAIYQGATMTERGGSVSYAFSIEPSQNYSIWLHFAEIQDTITGLNQRVFNVLCNEQLLFSNVDIWALAGGVNAAVVLNATLLVDGKTLTLDFTPVTGDILVCAIEVYQIMPREFPTHSEEVWALQSMKPKLGVPPRMGWSGDPCAPQEHPWIGIDCKPDKSRKLWFIDGLDIVNQGLRGVLTNEVAVLTAVDHINLNNNFLQSSIPEGIGSLKNLTRLDLANNKLNGSIPAFLGTLVKLTELYLNDNELTGKVPPALAAGPVRGASYNFLGNPGLCGIPSLRSCNQLSALAVAGIVLGTLLGVALLLVAGYTLWKRRENIARARKILSPPKAPYAAARTSSVEKNIQLSRYTSFTDTV